MTRPYSAQQRAADKQQVFEAIRDNPGIKSEKLQQTLNIGRGVLLTILRELMDSEHITQLNRRKSGYHPTERHRKK